MHSHVPRMYSGAIENGQMHGPGRLQYANNDVFKTKVGAKLLAEPVRWNDSLKCYTAKVWTPEQAIMLREAMKMVSEQDEADLAAHKRAERMKQLTAKQRRSATS